jgi:hypothetical protein
MEAAAWTLLGTAVGALINNFGGEHYKRYRDRRALAFGLAGEVGANMHAITDEVLGQFEMIADQARAGKDVPFPPFPTRTDPFFERAIEKIGLLEGDIPQRLALFYGHVQGARHSLRLLGEGFYGKTGEKLARVIEMHVKDWREFVRPIGAGLMVDLRTIGRRSFPATLVEAGRSLFSAPGGEA